MAKKLKDGDVYKHDGKKYVWSGSENNLTPDKAVKSLTYSEKLKDPRWQRKRLETMNRDEWKCRLCNDDKSTLQVHHKRYINGNDPWNYESDDLITLCESCHGLVEQGKKGIKNFDINNAKAHCIQNNNSVISIFRYEDRVPIIFVRHGTHVALDRDDIKKILIILSEE